MQQGYCASCARNVAPKKTGTNHVVNFIMTLLTGGLWLIVWLLLTVYANTYSCSFCGGSVTKVR